MKDTKIMVFDFSTPIKKVKIQLFDPIKAVEQPNLVSIHSAIMNLGKLLFVLPYSVKRYFSGNRPHYEVVRNSVASVVLIVILQTLYLIFTVVPLYRHKKLPVLDDSDEALKSPISVTLKTVVAYLIFAKQMVSMYVIWTSKLKVPKIQSELSRVSVLTTNLCGNPTDKQIKSITWTMVAIFLSLNLWYKLNFIINYDRLDKIALENYPNQLATRFNAWYERNSTWLDSYTTLQLVGGIGVTVTSFYSIVMETYIDLWSLTAAVLLNFIMGNLVDKLKNGDIQFNQEYQVLELLDRICRYVDGTNDAIYWVYAANVAITLPYQAAYLMDVFYSEMSFAFTLNLAINLVFYVGILVVAANANSKSRRVSCWLQSGSFDSADTDKHKPMSRRVSVLVSRLDSDVIAFRGGPFFILTDSFLGSAISFIITYCVIIIQNQK